MDFDLMIDFCAPLRTPLPVAPVSRGSDPSDCARGLAAGLRLRLAGSDDGSIPARFLDLLSLLDRADAARP